MQKKFKVWDKRKKQWIKNIVLTPEGIMLWQFGYDISDVNQDDFETVFYTGLKDNNDKEIYEGHVLLRLGMKQVVKWAGIGWNPWHDDMVDAEKSYRYEIVGTIQENPELLEEKEEA